MRRLSLSRPRESRSVAEGPGEAPLATKRSRLARRADRPGNALRNACAHVAIAGVLMVVFVLLVRPQEFVPALQTFSVLDAVTAITALGVVVEVALGKQKKPWSPQIPWLAAFIAWCFLVTVRRLGLAGFAGRGGGGSQRDLHGDGDRRRRNFLSLENDGCRARRGRRPHRDRLHPSGPAAGRMHRDRHLEPGRGALGRGTADGRLWTTNTSARPRES